VTDVVPLEPVPPLVGRDEITERILASAHEAFDRGRSVVTAVIGGPGSGKSRLLDHVCEVLTKEGSEPLILRGSCREQRDEPFDPLPRILQTRFALNGDLDDIGQRIAVTRLVTSVFGNEEARTVTEVVHMLGHLAGIPFPQSPILRSLEGEPQQYHARLLRALQRFIGADARAHRQVWVLDDLHNASPETLALLHDLVGGLGDVPFLVLVAGLPSLRGSLETDEESLIELPPLSDEAMTQLFALLLPGLPEPPVELTEAAIERAGGNPASMREIGRILLDSGVVDSSTDPWRTDLSKLAAADLPVSLEDALRARRQRLGSRTLAILERAAVIGEIFWDEAVLALGRGDSPPTEYAEPAQIWPDDSETAGLESTLRRLEDGEFVVPLEGSEFPRVREYAFRYAGLRDQVYAEIDPERLRRYHLLAAQWLERAPQPQREQFLEQIADHWTRAGDRARAAAVLLEAARQSRSRSLNDKAIRLFERGLMGLSEEDRLLRIDALHDLGSTHELVGDYDSALERLTEMLRDAWILVHRGKAGAALNKIGRIHRARGDYPAARAYLQRGLQLFRAADDTRGVASSLDDLGNLYWLLGHYQRALDHSAEALEIRRTLGDRRGEGVALINIGHIESARGYLHEADACYREALATARAIGDRDMECKALNAIGAVFHTRGDDVQAIEIWRSALTIAEDVGDCRMQSFLLNNLGEALTMVGDRKSAERYLLDCEALAQERDDRRVLAEVYRNLGTLMMRHNEIAESRDYLERSLRTARAMGSKEAVGLALRGLGELSSQTVFHDDGTTHEGERYFHEALEIFEQIGNEVELARTLQALGTYWLERDEMERARDALQRARDIYERVAPGDHMRLDETLKDISGAPEPEPVQADEGAEEHVPVVIVTEGPQRSDDTSPDLEPTDEG
jgi:tetratricopeptide (TPR) repeat protein